MVASSWFIGESESLEMWNKYADDPRGVILRSTPARLWRSMHHAFGGWWMDRVKYVDMDAHNMDVYQAHQACELAFLKNEKFKSENELRIATMNWVVPGCLNPDGSAQSNDQKSGLVYSEERNGILVKTDLQILLTEIRSAPNAKIDDQSEIVKYADKIGFILQKSEFS